MPDAWQENLAAFYVVHPACVAPLVTRSAADASPPGSLTLRGALAILPFWLFSPFARGSFVSKVMYRDRLEHLWEHMEESAVRLSRAAAAAVREHDRELEAEPLMDYGVRAPPSSAQAVHDHMLGLPAPL